MPAPKVTRKLFGGDKRRYRQYRTRTSAFPPGYRTAILAIERYLYIFGPGRGDSILTMLDDLADLFDQGAAAGTPLREIVGEDPVEFVDTFLRNYPEGSWITRERARLAAAVDRAMSDPDAD